MAAKPRKTPTGPAERQALGLSAVAQKASVLPAVAPGAPLPSASAQPPPAAAAATPVSSEVVPPESPPPAQPFTPLAQPGAPVLPRSPEDFVHNVMVRQLAEDLEAPPEDAEGPELKTLSALASARQGGKSLGEDVKVGVARTLSGGEDLDRLAWHLYRRHQTHKLVDWLRADDAADRLLLRMYNRGDFTAMELLVMKKMSQTKVKELAEELLEGLREGYPELNREEALINVDVAQVTTETQTLMEKTTPQGREIVRKLVFTAHQKLKARK